MQFEKIKIMKYITITLLTKEVYMARGAEPEEIKAFRSWLKGIPVAQKAGYMKTFRALLAEIKEAQKEANASKVLKGYSLEALQSEIKRRTPKKK